VKLKSAVFLSQIKAVCTQLRSAASPQTLNRILAEAEVGNFMYFVEYFEAAYLRDTNVLNLFKSLTDDAGVAERATTQFMKALSDQGVTTDEEFIEFFKSLADTAAVSEAHALATSKPLAEIVANAEDSTYIFAKKVKMNAVGLTDQLNSRGTGKPLFDGSEFTDSNIVFTSKHLTDVPTAGDSLLRDTTKQLTDSVFATDDVDGEASILDDQEMQFVKQKTDTAGVSELIYTQKGYVRAFFDSGYFADAQALQFSKDNTDALSATDYKHTATGKYTHDAPVASEILAKSFARPSLDSALLGDATVVAAGKVLLDLTSTTDAGSLRSQGFADFTYFAEDYVGASRTF